MLQAIEAEISADGHVVLQEPLHLNGTYRAVVTVLEPINAQQKPRDSQDLVNFLRENKLPLSARRSAEEIDAQIKKERDAWD